MSEPEMNQIVNYSQSEGNILTMTNGYPSTNNDGNEIDTHYGDNNFSSNNADCILTEKNPFEQIKTMRCLKPIKSPFL